MRPLRLVLVAALLCGVPACGRGGEPKAAPSPVRTPVKTVTIAPPPMAKKAYVAEANKLCLRAEKGGLDRGSAKGLLAETERYVAALTQSHREIRALAPPAADRAAIQKNFLALADLQVALLRSALPKLRAAAARDDDRAAGEAFAAMLAQYEKVAKPFEAWVSRYGLKDCI